MRRRVVHGPIVVIGGCRRPGNGPATGLRVEDVTATSLRADPGYQGRSSAAAGPRFGLGRLRVARPVVVGRFGWLLSLLAGGLAVLAFPPIALWPCAPISVALFGIAVVGQRPRTGAWFGLLYGLAFLVPLLRWTATYVGAVGYILAVFESLFFALMGALLAASLRLRGWPVWAAALWVAQEAARDRVPFGGFPWGRLAFSQPGGPYLPLASIGGAPLVSLAVALSGFGLAAAGVAVVRRPARWRRVAAAAVLGALLVPAVGQLLWLRVSDGSGSPTVTIAAIQGNVPRLGLDFNAQREAVLRNHVDATLALARRVASGRAPRPRIVVWPEDASDVDPLADPGAGALIDQAASAIGVPILVGGILRGPGRHIRNVGIVWDPKTGPGAIYTKRHPVPFGEYIPLRSLARKVTSKVDLVPYDMLAGHTVGALKMAGLTVGDVICFEVAYDSLVRSDVLHGAQLIVTQTNNATFGHSGESPQQLAMAQLRAVEHNRTNVVVSTSGISAIIAPDGSVRARSAIFTQATFDQPVAIQHGETIATRIGELPEWVATALGLAATALGLILGSGRGPAGGDDRVAVRQAPEGPAPEGRGRRESER